MKKVKLSYHDDLNDIIVPQVCDGYQDCPQTSKSNGGEDEDDCGDGESLEISIAGKNCVLLNLPKLKQFLLLAP